MFDRKWLERQLQNLKTISFLINDLNNVCKKDDRNLKHNPKILDVISYARRFGKEGNVPIYEGSMNHTHEYPWPKVRTETGSNETPAPVHCRESSVEGVDSHPRLHQSGDSKEDRDRRILKSRTRSLTRTTETQFSSKILCQWRIMSSDNWSER